ncbi:MAG: carboxypeptidase-like regulatory domain-containing protein [Polyangiaceae bacterium]|nr:carboxypeptidase-like regulatory domain-containing protein [Polyangiaceae bacterium]
MRRLLVLLAAALVASGCRDPVLEAKADALGPDPGPYEEGPLHRAGFPCNHCHARGGRASPHFDLAGTVYADKDAAEGLEGVTVRLFDSTGRQQSVTTNAVGTFALGEGALELDFPLWVRLELGDEVRSMQSPIFRERSCAACHRNPASPNRHWQVHLRGDP